MEPRGEQWSLLQRPAAPRAHERRERRRMDPDLLEPVAVEIEPLDAERLAAPELPLGQRELVPDRAPQMLEVQPPDHAVPLPLVALRPAHRPARYRGVPAVPAQDGDRLRL